MSAITPSRINADTLAWDCYAKSAFIDTRLVYVGHAQNTFATAKVLNIFSAFPKIVGNSFRKLWVFYSEDCG